ncbi:unnamed protein product [Tenebrio molitor]|nr:unnamed protein product [Tenebrio molitor]
MDVHKFHKFCNSLNKYINNEFLCGQQRLHKYFLHFAFVLSARPINGRFI